MPRDFETVKLDSDHTFVVGTLPAELAQRHRDLFEELWALHPDDFHEIVMAGRRVKTPRWQQAYGADYHYTGRVNRALPVPAGLEPLRTWARGVVDERLNGILLNWYEAAREQYIGKHRDSTVQMVEGSSIVTISLGAARTFRLRPWRREGPPRDFRAEHGTVFVMPWETNLAWTHEVPHFARDEGRRISVTLRAFETEPAGPGVRSLEP